MEKSQLIILSLLVISVLSGIYIKLEADQIGQPWMNKNLTPEERAKQLIAKMTLEQKVSMLHGQSGQYTGNVNAIPELNIPALKLNDGPQGFRDNDRHGTTTAFPSGMTVAASFDTDLLYIYGKAMGTEFYNKGANVQLGPGMDLDRVPYCGRNFEYTVGEDPYLGYTLIQPLIRGIQDQQVIANAKHYVINSQEHERSKVSENPEDERTLFEIYYPPFEGAVVAGVGSMMCSYNKIHNVYSCENPTTLAKNLKKDLNFNGWVMSDWGATHSTSIQQGLDQEMPGSTYFGAALLDLVKSGKIAQSYVDDSVFRILVPMFRLGIFDNPNPNKITNNVTNNEQVAIARNLSAQSTILLKNADKILPLSASKLSKIAIIGKAGDQDPIIAGTGSGRVEASYITTPFWGIRDRFGLPRPNATFPYKDCIGNKCVYYHNGENEEKAAELAKTCDIAIVVIGIASGEGHDRSNLEFGSRQESLVERIGKANANTIVLFQAPGPVLTQWSSHAKAIVTNLLPGLQSGAALADVLFGDVNPSARLPFTMPNKENEMEMTTKQYPGILLENSYSEKLNVGYRWYNAHNVKPAFEFGFGLSYTVFEYDNLAISGRTVSFSILNAGFYNGCEIAQLYVDFPATAGEPPRQLKGFQKLCLRTGQQYTIKMALTDRDVSIWDEVNRKWAVQHGSFNIYVGASSLDIKLKGTMAV